METKRKRSIYIAVGMIVISMVTLHNISKEKVYCGVVTNKINALEYNKTTARPDPILIVKFDVNQKKKEIHTSWITFTEAKENERICFTEKVLEMEPIWIEAGLLMLIACITILCGIAMILNAFGVFDTTGHESYY